MRRRLLKVREKKSLVKIGRRIQELHQSGESDWPGDSKVKEIIQELEDSSRKREELKSLLQERKDRFREKVQKLKEKGAESAAEGDE
jgi:small-conductance mechanosensitive channel